MAFGIKLKNKHIIDYVCASGALNMHGKGYFWERPFLYSKHLKPEDFLIITKTITYPPVKGNYRAYAPWRCVRLIKDGVVNAFGLSNKGLRWWLQKCYPKINKQYRIIPSIMPHNAEQAKIMASELDKIKNNLVALEINLSCVNIKHSDDNWHLASRVKAIAENTDLQLILKFGIQNDFVTLTKELKSIISAVDLINSVNWNTVFPHQSSPLTKYNLVGAVSGLPIKQLARDALAKFKLHFGNTIPIISGGGIYSYDECLARRVMGANALSFGTLFLKQPWMPNKIVDQLKNTKGWSR